MMLVWLFIFAVIAWALWRLSCGFVRGFREEWQRRRPSLAEQGRRLASEREDLIARGVDPADLEVPLYPDDEEERP